MTDPLANDAVERLATLQRSAADNELGDDERRRQRTSFLTRLDREDQASGWSRRFAIAIWGLPAVAAGLALWVWSVSARSISFDVQGAQRDGAYVRAGRDAPATVHFSDETTVVAAAGTRLRIEETSASGARVLVEQGRADVHVVHHPAGAWMFVAGPFEVKVTGTRFAMSWDATSETFELALAEGAVEVRGPTGSGPVVVHAGQRFHGDVQHATMFVANLTAEGETPTVVQPLGSVGVETALPPAPSASAPSASAVAAPAVNPEPRGAPKSHGERAKADGWPQLITRGDFTGIVQDAEQRGIAGCLSTCSVNDLRALADAARYTGRDDLAEQSLRALRDRFATGAGRDAAFSLGRLDERRGAWASATKWYDTYLREAPAGTFAAEALAGKMRVARKLGGKEAAAPIARDDLNRFPTGVHVELAREILSGN